MKDLLIVSATSKTQTDFDQSTLLGISLRKLAFDRRVSSAVTYENGGLQRRSLGSIYNAFLTSAFSDRHILFVHDDVHIDDCFIWQRLNDALATFDVVGVAGNKAPDFRQPSWALKWKRDGTSDGWQDAKNLSGAVAH